MVELVLGEPIEPSLPMIFDFTGDAGNWIKLTDESYDV